MTWTVEIWTEKSYSERAGWRGLTKIEASDLATAVEKTRAILLKRERTGAQKVRLYVEPEFHIRQYTVTERVTHRYRIEAS